MPSYFTLMEPKKYLKRQNARDPKNEESTQDSDYEEATADDLEGQFDDVDELVQ